MSKNKSKFYRFLTLFLILFSASALAFGQKPVKCKVEKDQLPKYKIADWSRGESKLASLPPALLMKTVIKPKDINDGNLIALARHLKQIYCNETRVIIQIFDNKRATQLDPLENIVAATPRATYFFDREKNEESLKTYVVKNNRQVGTEIKLLD